MKTTYNLNDQTPVEDFSELNTKSQVREVQQFLLSKGYDLGRWGVDGKLGNYTNTAIYNFFRGEMGNPINPSNNNNTNPSNTNNNSGNELDRLITQYGNTQFYNSSDINAFFTQHTGKDFCTWFKDHVGNRGYWARITFEGKRKNGRNIPRSNFNTHRNNFNKVFDNIPLLYSGSFSRHGINIFQFFALVSIIINETGGKFVPISERGSLAYMFGTNGGKKKSYNTAGSNIDAYTLFRNATFLNAHRSLPYYSRVANTTSRSWAGSSFPSGFPTRYPAAGIVAEADFYKFRGRGLIQTTFRGSYKQLVRFVKAYSGSNTIINQYKNAWRSLSDDAVLHTSRNADWDKLFMQTNLELASQGVYLFQKRRNNFFHLPANKTQLLKEHRSRSGSGSFFYVGYRVGGNSRYGRLIKARILQMIKTLNV